MARATTTSMRAKMRTTRIATTARRAVGCSQTLSAVALLSLVGGGVGEDGMMDVL